jgi:hypothetical protein
LLQAAGGTLAGVGGLGLTTGQPPERTDGFEAGTARVDASPRPTDLEEGVYLGGFGIGPQPSRRATGNHDGVSARALAVSAGDTTVVQAVLDLTGLGNTYLTDIRERAAARTGVDPAGILVAATHTHAGPDFQGLWGGVPEVYREYVVDRTTEAIVQAVEAQRPARGFVGSVDASDLASNRRYDDAGTVSTLTALQFRGARSGETLGTLVNFAAHPTIVGSGNSLVATDYVGPLERALEAEFGGTAVYLQGALGDASAAGPGGEDDYAAAANYGEALASRASAALDDADRVHGGLRVRETSLELPVDNCLFKAAFEVGLLQPYYDPVSVTGQVTDPAGEAISGVDPALGREVEDSHESGGLAIPSPVARVTLGDDRRSVEYLTVPGEATTALGRDLRALGGDAFVTAGLTQNSLGYLIPKQNYDDGYEETVSLGPDTAPLYRNAVTELYDLDRPAYERVAPGPEATCPAAQSQFRSYRNQYGPEDGPLGAL